MDGQNLSTTHAAAGAPASRPGHSCASSGPADRNPVSSVFEHGAFGQPVPDKPINQRTAATVSAAPSEHLYQNCENHCEKIEQALKNQNYEDVRRLYEQPFFQSQLKQQTVDKNREMLWMYMIACLQLELEPELHAGVIKLFLSQGRDMLVWGDTQKCQAMGQACGQLLKLVRDGISPEVDAYRQLLESLSLMGTNRDQALALLKKAVESGLPDACFWLGIYNINHDPGVAMENLKSAWDQGIDCAGLFLGQACFMASDKLIKMIEVCQGCQNETDITLKEQARKGLIDIAECASIAGQWALSVQLADFYMSGVYGFPRDHVRAWTLLDTAVAHGSPAAIMCKADWMGRYRQPAPQRSQQSRILEAMSLVEVSSAAMLRIKGTGKCSDFVKLVLGKPLVEWHELGMMENMYRDYHRGVPVLPCKSAESSPQEQALLERQQCEMLLQLGEDQGFPWFCELTSGELRYQSMKSWSLASAYRGHGAAFMHLGKLLLAQRVYREGRAMALLCSRLAERDKSISASLAGRRELALRTGDWLEAQQFSQRLCCDDTELNADPDDFFWDYVLNSLLQETEVTEKLDIAVSNGCYRAVMLKARQLLAQGQTDAVSQVLKNQFTIEAFLLCSAACHSGSLPKNITSSRIFQVPSACFCLLDLHVNRNFPLPENIEVKHLVAVLSNNLSLRECQLRRMDPGARVLATELAKLSVEEQFPQGAEKLKQAYMLTGDVGYARQLGEVLERCGKFDAATAAYEWPCVEWASVKAFKDRREPIKTNSFEHWDELMGQAEEHSEISQVHARMIKARSQARASGQVVPGQWVNGLMEELNRRLPIIDLSPGSRKQLLETVGQELLPLLDTVVRQPEVVETSPGTDTKNIDFLRRYLLNMGLFFYSNGDYEQATLLLHRSAEMGCVEALQPAVVLLAHHWGYRQGVELIKSYQPYDQFFGPHCKPQKKWLEQWLHELELLDFLATPGAINLFSDRAEQEYEEMLAKADNIARQYSDGFGYAMLAQRLADALATTENLPVADQVLWKLRVQGLLSRAALLRTPAVAMSAARYLEARAPDMVPVNAMAFAQFCHSAPWESLYSIYSPRPFPGIDPGTTEPPGLLSESTPLSCRLIRAKQMMYHRLFAPFLYFKYCEKNNITGMAFQRAKLTALQTDLCDLLALVQQQGKGGMYGRLENSDKLFKKMNSTIHSVEQQLTGDVSGDANKELQHNLAFLKLFMVQIQLAGHCQRGSNKFLKQCLQSAAGLHMSHAWTCLGLLERDQGSTAALDKFRMGAISSEVQAPDPMSVYLAALVYQKRKNPGDAESAQAMLETCRTLCYPQAWTLALRQELSEGTALKDCPTASAINSQPWLREAPLNKLMITYGQYLANRGRDAGKKLLKFRDSSDPQVLFHLLAVVAKEPELTNATYIKSLVQKLMRCMTEMDALCLVDDPDTPVVLKVLLSHISLYQNEEDEKELKQLTIFLNPANDITPVQQLQCCNQMVTGRISVLIKQLQENSTDSCKALESLLEICNRLPDQFDAEKLRMFSRCCLKVKKIDVRWEHCFEQCLKLHSDYANSTPRELLIGHLHWLSDNKNINRQVLSWVLDSLKANSLEQVTSADAEHTGDTLLEGIVENMLTHCAEASGWQQLNAVLEVLGRHCCASIPGLLSKVSSVKLSRAIAHIKPARRKGQGNGDDKYAQMIVEELNRRLQQRQLTKQDGEHLRPLMIGYYQEQGRSCRPLLLEWISMAGCTDDAVDIELNKQILKALTTMPVDKDWCRTLKDRMHNPQRQPFSTATINTCKNNCTEHDSEWFQWLDNLPRKMTTQNYSRLSVKSLLLQMQLREQSNQSIHTEVAACLDNAPGEFFQLLKDPGNQLPSSALPAVLALLKTWSSDQLRQVPVSILQQLLAAYPEPEQFKKLLPWVDISFWSQGTSAQVLVAVSDYLSGIDACHNRNCHQNAVLQAVARLDAVSLQQLSPVLLLSVVPVVDSVKDLDPVLQQLEQRLAASDKQAVLKLITELEKVINHCGELNPVQVKNFLACLAVMAKGSVGFDVLLQRHDELKYAVLRLDKEAGENKTNLKQHWQTCRKQIIGHMERLKAPEKAKKSLEEELEALHSKVQTLRKFSSSFRQQAELLKLRLEAWDDQSFSPGLQQQLRAGVARVRLCSQLDMLAEATLPLGADEKAALVQLQEQVKLQQLSNDDQEQLRVFTLTDADWQAYQETVVVKAVERIDALAAIDSRLSALVDDIVCIPACLRQELIPQLHDRLAVLISDSVKQLAAETRGWTGGKLPETLKMVADSYQLLITCEQRLKLDNTHSKRLDQVIKGCNKKIRQLQTQHGYVVLDSTKSLKPSQIREQLLSANFLNDPLSVFGQFEDWLKALSEQNHPQNHLQNCRLMKSELCR